MVTGWAYIWGIKVGILGNNGVIYSRGRQQGVDSSCSSATATAIPLLFLHNVTGFMVGKEYERRGITKDGAKMLMVQANVTVPKLIVLCHASQGAGNYAMAGRTWDPRFLFAWPNSTLLDHGRPSQAADTLTQVRVTALNAATARTRRRRRSRASREVVTAHFEQTYHSYYLTSDLRDDGLIDPMTRATRSACRCRPSLNAPIVRTPGGVLRI